LVMYREKSNTNLNETLLVMYRERSCKSKPIDDMGGKHTYKF
jgi:hypothetical protein